MLVPSLHILHKIQCNFSRPALIHRLRRSHAKNLMCAKALCHLLKRKTRGLSDLLYIFEYRIIAPSAIKRPEDIIPNTSLSSRAYQLDPSDQVISRRPLRGILSNHVSPVPRSLILIARRQNSPLDFSMIRSVSIASGLHILLPLPHDPATVEEPHQAHEQRVDIGIKAELSVDWDLGGHEH